MDANDTSKVVMVPVKRYDINLTLDDILTPLTETVNNITTKNMKVGADVAPHLLRFHDLVSQLHEVVTIINRIDPSLLASKEKK
ncbi:MAG: hypothetical protein PHY54_05110 [Methylococcales bacterium]|nr:hypothetical protein [Methylococcales bacterium]